MSFLKQVYTLSDVVMHHDVRTMPSPLGPISIRASSRGVRSLSFDEWNAVDETHSSSDDNSEILNQCATELQEYFSGTRTHFDVPLDALATDFQRRVWDELVRVPFGTSTSYLDIARRIGDVKSIRAVASANARNPIAIIIPCHRIIGSDGLLHGYAGGLHRKEWLLRHEGMML